MAQATPPPEFLTSVLGRYEDGSCQPPDINRPYVTLTFAQSLDAKIAGKRGAQLVLSGKESMIMTHWMRSMHDAVLVGIDTALSDDPQLNTRLLPPQDTHGRPARPVVLDSELRLPPACKLLQNYQAGRGRRPWVLCAPKPEEDTRRRVRAEALERAGARIVRVPVEHDLLSIPAVLAALHDLGIRTLMVEGGARVIGSFLAAPTTAAGRPVVDSVIVTVAPVFVGGDGVGYSVGLGEAQVTGFEHIRTELLGKDTVVAMTAVGSPAVRSGTFS